MQRTLQRESKVPEVAVRNVAEQLSHADGELQAPSVPSGSLLRVVLKKPPWGVRRGPGSSVLELPLRKDPGQSSEPRYGFPICVVAGDGMIS